MLHKRIALVLTVLILLSMACNIPVLTQEAPATAQVSQAATLTATPPYATVPSDATVTPTPFRPVPPTPTPVPTNTPTPTLTPTLDIHKPQSSMPAGRPVQPGGPLPDGVVNILVMGSDSRGDGGFRTDVMMLVSINRNKNAVSVVSVPRDLYVNIPGWETNRINTAMVVGGFNTMASVFETNFKVRPNYYIMTNFDGFKGIINSLGGVNVKVRESLYDKCDLPIQDKYGYCNIEAPVTMPMDGTTALWYVRSRHSTSDFDRLRRAQEVLLGIFNKLMSLDAVARAPEIFALYQKSVETNLTLDQIIPLVSVASEISKDPGRIHRFALTPSEAIPYVTPGGAMVLWPNLPAIQSIFYEAVYQ